MPIQNGRKRPPEFPGSLHTTPRNKTSIRSNSFLFIFIFIFIQKKKFKSLVTWSSTPALLGVDDQDVGRPRLPWLCTGDSNSYPNFSP